MALACLVATAAARDNVSTPSQFEDTLLAQAFETADVVTTFDEATGLTRIERPEDQSVIFAVRVGRTLLDRKSVV